MKEARDESGRNIFEIFGSNDLSLLLAEWCPDGTQYNRETWRQDSSASASEGGWQASLGQSQEQMILGWSQDEKRVIDAVEDYLEKCAQVIVKIDLVESLLRPENLEVSLRYVLKHSTCEEAAISSSSSTQQKSRITSLQAEDDGWKVREVTMRGRRMGETSGATLGIKEPRQKLRRAPTALLQTPLPQQSSPSAREEEEHWELREERRRRRIAFENLAKEMLRYLDNCNEVKVGITECCKSEWRCLYANRYFHSASGPAGEK